MNAGEFIAWLIIVSLFLGGVYNLWRYYQQNQKKIETNGIWSTYRKVDGWTFISLWYVGFMVSLSVMIGFFELTEFSSNSETRTEIDDSENSSGSSSSTTTESSEDTPPDGYRKGYSCSTCSGTGYYTHDVPGFPNSKGGVCAGCNGKGYHWERK